MKRFAAILALLQMRNLNVVDMKTLNNPTKIPLNNKSNGLIAIKSKRHAQLVNHTIFILKKLCELISAQKQFARIRNHPLQILHRLQKIILKPFPCNQRKLKFKFQFIVRKKLLNSYNGGFKTMMNYFTHFWSCKDDRPSFSPKIIIEDKCSLHHLRGNFCN